MRLPGPGDRQDVRVQKAGKETNQKEEGRGDGAERESDSTED